MKFMEEAYKLRDKTPIGSFIRFRTFNHDGNFKPTVSGIVTAKYPHIFILDNKQSYTWKEYLLGR